MIIKILQWNILFKEKAENILKLIKEIDADILCLQEVTQHCSHNDGRDVSKLIAEETGLKYNFAPAGCFEDGLIIGNTIFSRFPIKENDNFVVKDYSGGKTASDEQRVCALSTLDLGGGKTITISTTHLSYIPFMEETEDKIKQIKKLTDFFSKHNGPLVFTGDLNVSSDTNSIKMIEEHLIHCGPNYSEPTWTTKPFSLDGFEEDQLRWRLDYAFASPDVKVLSAKILKTEYSDHLPILIEIEI